MIKDEPYDWRKMRGGIGKMFSRNGALDCAGCGENTWGGFHPHHALVKSSQVRHWAVDNAIENRVPLCPQCHDAHGQSSEMIVKALDYLCERLTAKRVAEWWVSLWRDHGLTVVRGTLPEGVLFFRCEDCGHDSDDADSSAWSVACYGDDDHAPKEWLDLGAVAEREWREYLELVCLPLGCAA